MGKALYATEAGEVGFTFKLSGNHGSVDLTGEQNESSVRFSPEGGTFTEPQTVTLSCPAGWSILYTTDGSNPGLDSFAGQLIGNQYTSPITVDNTTTIKAVTYKAKINEFGYPDPYLGYTVSDIVEQTYTISQPVLSVNAPTFDPSSGTYTMAQQVAISCETEDAVIHYTTDGTEPTPESPVYTGLITISEDTTLRAVAMKEGLADSLVVTEEYVIHAPGFDLPGSGTEADPWQIMSGMYLNVMPEGWYEVKDSTTLSQRIAVSGNVNLILGAGTTLTALQGINVSSGNSLTISGSGTLNAVGCEGCAGIGGGIDESCGTVTINGGTVNATGSVWGAGIGGGKGGGNGGNITINGGNITAQCYDPNNAEVGLAAGIGGGDLGIGGTILITGGTVYARGNRGSAGIGGGGYANGGTITITGGHVTAIGASYPNGRSGAGIGAGRVRNNATSGDSGTITIAGGTVIAIGGSGAQAIGVSNEVAANDSGTLTLGSGLMVKAGGSESTAVIASGDLVAACRSAWAMISSSLPFGTPDFTLPAAITTVEEEAFLSAGMSVVLVPDSCTSISDHAFKDCAALTQIHIPATCTLGTDVFDGCTLVYVFGTSGSPAETYCQEHENCVFVKE